MLRAGKYITKDNQVVPSERREILLSDSEVIGFSPEWLFDWMSGAKASHDEYMYTPNKD